MRPDIHSLIDQSAGNFDPKLLTQTGAGGVFSKGTLESKPLVEYLRTEEIPHFILSTTRQGPVVEGFDTAPPPDLEKYRAFGVVTETRILLLVGSEDGDYEYSIPLIDIQGVETATESGLLRSTQSLTLATLDGGTIEIVDTEGSDISETTYFIKRKASICKVNEAEARLQKAKTASKSNDFAEAISTLDTGMAMLDPARAWAVNITSEAAAPADTYQKLQEYRDRVRAAQALQAKLDTIWDQVRRGDEAFRATGLDSAVDHYEYAVSILESDLEAAHDDELPIVATLQSRLTEVRRRIAPNLQTPIHRDLHEIFEIAQTATEQATATDDIDEEISNLQAAIMAYQQYLDLLTNAGFDEVSSDSVGCAVCNRNPAILCEISIDTELVRTCAACAPFGDKYELERSASIKSRISELEMQLSRQRSDLGNTSEGSQSPTRLRAKDTEDTTTSTDDDGAEEGNTGPTDASERSPNEDEPPTRENLISELRRLDASLDRPVKATDMGDQGGYSQTEYYSEFGSWEEALHEAGIDRRDQCLDEIGYVREQIARFPNQADIGDVGRVSGPFIRSEFEDWTAALRAFADREGITGQTASDEDLLGEIERLANKQPDLVMPSDMASNGVFGPTALEDRFGSWTNALEASGFSVTENILDSIRRMSRDLDDLPTASDIEESDRFDIDVVRDVFGSIDAALGAYFEKDDTPTPGKETRAITDTAQSTKETNSESNPSRDSVAAPEDPTRDDLLGVLRSLQASTDYPIKSTDINTQTPYQTHQFTDEFGSLDTAFEEAGIDRLSDLLGEFHRVAKELGHPPSGTEFNRHAHVSNGLLYNEFDSWHDVKDAYQEWASESGTNPIEEVKQNPTSSSNQQQKSTKPQSTMKTDETLEEAIKRIASDLTHPIQPFDLQQHSEYGYRDFQQAYDSWIDAVEAAGIDREQELLTEFHRVAKKLGHVPEESEMRNHAQVSLGALYRPFGSWANAKKRYIGEYNEELPSNSDDGETCINRTGNGPLEELHRVAEDLDSFPSYSEFDNRSNLSGGHLTSKIGTWDEVKRTYIAWATQADYTPITGQASDESESDSVDPNSNGEGSNLDSDSDELMTELENEIEELLGE
jgi:hypothetical protein